MGARHGASAAFKTCFHRRSWFLPGCEFAGEVALSVPQARRCVSSVESKSFIRRVARSGRSKEFEFLWHAIYQQGPPDRRDKRRTRSSASVTVKHFRIRGETDLNSLALGTLRLGASATTQAKMSVSTFHRHSTWSLAERGGASTKLAGSNAILQKTSVLKHMEIGCPKSFQYLTINGSKTEVAVAEQRRFGEYLSSGLIGMNTLLKGQVAVVTGAGSGIGAAVAMALADAGATVIVNHPHVEAPADEIVRQIKSNGGNSFAIAADVSNEDEVIGMFRDTVAKFGTVDILVANAGLQRDSPFTQMSLANWQFVLNVNLTGQFLCAREATREFLRRGPDPSRSIATGKIICMSSVHQVIPWGGHCNYATSKGGIKLFMESIAQELAPHKIRVNAIGPGAIKTPINRTAWETPAAEAALRTLIPYNRVGVPEDIAKAAVWLASDESDYVTGTTLFVDGGMTLYPGFATGG